MSEHHELRAGAYSGLLAIIMVVALAFMAFAALEPVHEPPLRITQIDVVPELPKPEFPTRT